MNIQDVLESAHIVHDTKARRVLNTAPNKQAGITINELESGVTIERLESLEVPVYQYSTQITIHGIFKDIPENFRVCGYKSIILNDNGSLGVRYAAIDAGKKQMLRHVSRYAKTGWSIFIDSRGCEAIKMFHTSDHDSDKVKCIECYKSTPDSLYIGGKQAVSLMYGGYAVIVHIGAIYEPNLWKLISELTGISSESDYESIAAESKRVSDAKYAEYLAKAKIEREALEAKVAESRANFIAPSNWKPFSGTIDKPGIYARINRDYMDRVVLQVIMSERRGGRLCSTTREFQDMQYQDWKPLDRYKAMTIKIADGWVIESASQVANTKPVAIKPMPTNGSKPMINHNEKLNGIELKFSSKPDNGILSTLKQLGFRWSQYNGIWYSRHSEGLMTQVQSMFGGA